jgi:predicted nucleotidyltransferase
MRTEKESRNTLFSRTRRAILSLLFGHTEEAFYLRQIVRASGYGLGPVQRELKLLSEAGIIRRTARGRQVYFQANSDSPIFPELKSLVAKTVGVGDSIRGALASIAKDIKLAFIYGSIARGDERPRSDIDLLIVGDLTFSDVVVSLQGAQKTLGREINPTVYSGVEFRAKLRKNHHFLASAINGPKIFLIGDENELGRLAQKRMARRSQDKSKRDL